MDPTVDEGSTSESADGSANTDEAGVVDTGYCDQSGLKSPSVLSSRSSRVAGPRPKESDPSAFREYRS